MMVWDCVACGAKIDDENICYNHELEEAVCPVCDSIDVFHK